MLDQSHSILNLHLQLPSGTGPMLHTQSQREEKAWPSLSSDVGVYRLTLCHLQEVWEDSSEISDHEVSKPQAQRRGRQGENAGPIKF